MFLFIMFGLRMEVAVREWQCVKYTRKYCHVLSITCSPLVAHHKRDLFIYRLVTCSTLEAS